MITSQPPSTGAQAGHDPASGAVFLPPCAATQRSRFDSGNRGLAYMEVYDESEV